MLHFRSLTTQLLLLIVFPVMILLTLAAYGGVSLHEVAMRTLVSDRDQRAVSAAAEALTDRFNSRMLVLKAVAARLGDGKTLEALLQSDPSLKEIFDGGLVVTDKSGKALESWQPGTNWTGMLAQVNSAWVLDHDRPVPLVVLNVDDVPHEQRIFGGVLLPNLNAPEIVKTLTTSATSRLIILADDGHIIQDVNGQPGTSTPHEMTSHSDGTGQSDLVTVSRRVEGLNWTIVLQESWTEVANPYLKMTLVAPLAILPALLLAIGVLAYGIYSIVLPLRRLGRLAAQISWGNYSLGLQPVGGVQEIQDLQINLNHMAQRLQESQNATQSYIGATLQGQEEERKRLARELHDDTLQSLIALDQKRQMTQRALQHDPNKATEHLAELQTLLGSAITNLRELLRDMRPSYIEDLGLTPALEMLAAQVAEKSGLMVQFRLEGTPTRLPPNHELALYRITQEAVNNAVRHSHASEITVTLRFHNPMTLTIQDNGRGFVVPERPQFFAQKGHYGLMGIVERVEQIKGSLEITSSISTGTQIHIQLGAVEKIFQPTSLRSEVQPEMR